MRAFKNEIQKAKIEVEDQYILLCQIFLNILNNKRFKLLKQMKKIKPWTEKRQFNNQQSVNLQNT